MHEPATPPPSRADHLLESTLPRGPKALTIIGDLHEEFFAIAARRGRGAARRWYWRSALQISSRYLARRIVRGPNEHHEGRGGEIMSSIIGDLKFGVRMLRRTPGLSAVAVLTIAFGVGLTTHMYSTVYGSVLRGLPVPDADRLVVVQQYNNEEGWSGGDVPYLDYLELLERNHGLESLAGYDPGAVNLAGDEGPPERYRATFMTANAFTVLGIDPILGRVFADGEDGPDVEPRLVLSHHVWQTRFAGDPEVIGRVVRANGRAAEIIGVMPEGFRFPFLEDMWMNLAFTRTPASRGSQNLDVFGRVPEGVDRDVVRSALSVVGRDLAATYPDDNAGTNFEIAPFAENYMPPEITAVLFLMLAATFGVLLIACANVANLLLARASLRSREVAIRTAMGASRLRVMRQMLSEALVLALAGGALGVVIAWVGVALFSRAIAPIEKPYWIVVELDPTALMFAVGVTLTACLAAGLYPALRASGLGMGDILRDETRGSSSLRLGRFSAALVVGEVAVSCALLVTAGFMIKSVANLRTIDLGFEAESVMTGRVELAETDYPTRQDRIAFFQELQSRIAALPGAENAALSTDLPGLGAGRYYLSVEGETYPSQRDHPVANANFVTAGFFDAVGTPFLSGRDFAPGEAWDPSERLVIVNESFARNVVGDPNPIGRRLKMGFQDSENEWNRIVGVVGDTYVGGGVGGIGDDKISPEQVFFSVGAFGVRSMTAVVKTAGPPEALVPAVRTIVSDMDSSLPLSEAGGLDDAISTATWAFGLFGSLFTIFGAAALFLAAVGLYGVMAFSVTQRRQELGVRMALGAGPERIMRLVLKRGVVQLGIGMVLGIGLGYGMAGPLSAVTYGVETGDLSVYGAIVLTLSLAGLVASIVPARLATRADPVESMRP